MDYRNPTFNGFGTIDCEIEHPVHGWIPFTCDPTDTGAGFDTASLFVAMQPHAPAYVPPPPPDPAEVLAAQHAEVQAARAAAYRDEADPLFFKYQRGEAGAQEWLDKVAEIRARYPYPEE
jgi:hypothetical protein